MDIEISTSDPANVDPSEIASAIEGAGYFVLSVSVNEGERRWESELFHTGKHEIGED